MLNENLPLEEDNNFYTSEEYDDDYEEVEAKEEKVNNVVEEEYREPGLMENMQTIKVSGDFEMEDVEGFEDDSDVLSPEERLRCFADDVISCLVGQKEIREYALGRLLSITNPRLFRDENYVLFSIIYNYRDRIKRLNIDNDFVRLYLTRNRKILQKARGYIDIHAYGEVEGSEELGYIAGVVKHFNRLVAKEPLSVGEFELTFEKYLIEFKSIEATKAYNQANMILTEGLTIGNKKLSGFEDSHIFLRKRLAEIEGLIDMRMGSGFTTMNEVLMEEKEDGKKPYKIGDFDKLLKLNEIYGGIYTGTFYQVIAPPKAGKSKLCARICHTLVVKYGMNVTVWAQEGGKEAWTAQMRAIHFDYTYNQGADIRDRKYGVDQDCILHDRFPSKELKELELSSKLDLSSNPEYGVVDYIDRPFEVETFIEDIDTSVKGNNSVMVIVDYLQLIGSSEKLPERERISTAYKTALTYCKETNVGFMTPAQYKQESFNALLAKGTTSDADLRTSGGGSAEVLRTPDIIFALWATTNDLMNNSMKILSVPCRFNKAFPEVDVYADLGTCEFISLEN